ncbi:MAG: protein phosphatase 2C domain-containing protein [Nocardioidaceae bacterium]
MQFDSATSPGRPDRANEDYFGSTEDVAVLLDGAGTPDGVESGCTHGVAWFSHTLGKALLDITAQQPAVDLAIHVRHAIDYVAGQHRHTCDLRHPGSPSATVIVTRFVETELQYLVLADSVLLLDTSSGPVAITDDREAQVGQRLRQEMDRLPTSSDAHAEALAGYVRSLWSHRNQPDGFWVASSEPRAADEALTASIGVEDVQSVALLSDGASRLVDRFHLSTWQQTIQLLGEQGPAALIQRVRQAERSDPDGTRWPRGKIHDDATAAITRTGR